MLTKNRVDLGLLNQTGLLLDYGILILTFALLGPLLGFLGLRIKQHRNGGERVTSIHEFLVWFGGGLIVGYLGILVLSIFVTKQVNSEIHVMN